MRTHTSVCTFARKHAYLFTHKHTFTDMGQLEDFRESLKKKKDLTQSNVREFEPKPSCHSRQGQAARRNISLSRDLHLVLKSLNIWMIKEHIADSPRITDTILEMLKVYYKKYPDAKKFVDEFCE